MGHIALVVPSLLTTLCLIALHQVSWTNAIGFGIVSFFVFCDGWYFIRLVLCYLVEQVDHWTSSFHPKPLFAKSELHGRVLFLDIDRNGHCNNARYLRECGFGRRDLWHCNGIWNLLKENGGNLVVGAQSVRYRRELSFGQRYTLETRLLCWDDRAFYVEHRFVTMNTESGDTFINAIVIVKNTVLGTLSPSKLVEKIQLQYGQVLTNPTMPIDIQKWIESNAASSTFLRKEGIRR